MEEAGVLVDGLLYWTSKRPSVVHSDSLVDDAQRARSRGLVFTVSKKERPKQRGPGVWRAVREGMTDLDEALLLARAVAQEPYAAESAVLTRGIIYWKSTQPQIFNSSVLESRLDSLPEDVAKAFRAASFERCFRSAVLACDWAVRHAAIGDDAVVAEAFRALLAGEPATVDLRERLTEMARGFDDASDGLRWSDATRSADAEQLYSKARAVQALSFVLDGRRERLGEAICESVAAMETPEELLSLVAGALDDRG